MYDENKKLLDLTGAVITNPGGHSPFERGPAKAVDGMSGTMWNDLNKGSLQITLPRRGPIVSAFTFTTGNDHPERDPVQWTLWGSNDESFWQKAQGTTTDYNTTLDRHTPTHVFQLDWVPPPSLMQAEVSWKRLEANVTTKRRHKLVGTKGQSYKLHSHGRKMPANLGKKIGNVDAKGEWPKNLAQCKKACNEHQGCHSFAYCRHPAHCWMLGTFFDGTEDVHDDPDCNFYYAV